MNGILDYNEFFEEVWDYISEDVVTDEFWQNNEEFIRELTFDYYEFYKKTIVTSQYGEVLFNPLSPSIVARLIEKSIEEFLKIGIVTDKHLIVKF